MIEDSIQENIPLEAGVRFTGSSAEKTGSLKPVIAFLFLGGVIITSIIGAHQWKQTLKIQRVFVEGSYILSPEEIVRASKVTAGASMFGINLSTVRENIQSMVYIKSVLVTRELPDVLRIQVEERKPIAAVPQQPIVLLDETGVVLSPYQGNALFDIPLITGLGDLQDVKLGLPVQNAQVLHAISLLQQAKTVDAEIYYLISEVHVSPIGEVILYSSDAGVPILLGKDDQVRKLLLLGTFWKQFVHQRGVERLRMVDLRFEDQVIARWKEDASRITQDGTPRVSDNHERSLVF